MPIRRPRPWSSHAAPDDHCTEVGRGLCKTSPESSEIASETSLERAFARFPDSPPEAVPTAPSVAALALRSWIVTRAGDAKVLPTPESGYCLGRTKNASLKLADNSLRRAKTSLRLLPDCAPRDGAGVFSPGPLRSSWRRSARVPSHSGFDRSPTPLSTLEKSVSQAWHRPLHGRAAERQQRGLSALERWARSVGPSLSLSLVWPGSLQPTLSCQITD
jgi:hypothetical protein